MCREHRPRAGDAPATTKEPADSAHERIFGLLPPLQLPVALSLLALLPTSAWLNRGFTVWFHILSAVYYLTRSPFLRSCLILQGADICLGWYAALAKEWFVDGKAFDSLYRNMPEALMDKIIETRSIDGSEYVVLQSVEAWSARLLSHCLDLLGHPILLCVIAGVHRRRGGTLEDVCTWPVIVATWYLSRTWSAVHSFHNNGAAAGWYFGQRVYRLNDQRSYLVAYVAEAICFVTAITYRMYLDWRKKSVTRDGARKFESLCIPDEKGADEKPGLVHSESATSTSSMSND